MLMMTLFYVANIVIDISIKGVMVFCLAYMAHKGWKCGK